MPLLTLPVKHSKYRQNPSVVDVYIPRPVSERDQLVLRRYYFDTVAQQRLRAEREITTTRASGAAVLVFMFAATTAYYSPIRLQHAIIGAVLVAIVLVWAARYRCERARRMLAVLATYRRVGVFSVEIGEKSVGTVHATAGVAGKITLLAPVPRLLRTADRLHRRCGVSHAARLTESLGQDYKRVHPDLHCAVDDVVAKYVHAARYYYEQLVDTDKPTRQEVMQASNAIDGEIYDTLAAIERVYLVYSGALSAQTEGLRPKS